MPRELQIPPAAVADPHAFEIARIWASQGAQHVTLQTDVWEDPAAWGIMLVDLARHIANAYEQTQGRDKDISLRQIRAGFDAEWQSPTDEATGELIP
jgi:hypothetical protein